MYLVKKNTLNLQDIKFSSLHQGINLIHAQVNNSHIHDKQIRYRLKDVNCLNINIFQCKVVGCQSHVIFKTSKNVLGKIQFLITDYNDKHNHNLQKKNVQTEERDQTIGIHQDFFGFIKNQLRYLYVLNQFRDFIGNFAQGSYQKNNSFPFILPSVIRDYKISTTFRIAYKILNETKKIILFIIQVWILDQIVTQLKYLHSLKNIKAQQFLFIISLIYIIANYPLSTVLEIDTNTYKSILNPKQNPSDQFIQLFKKIKSKFLNLQGQFKNNLINEKKLNLNLRQLNEKNGKHILQKLQSWQNKLDNFSINTKKNDISNRIKPSIFRAFNIYMGRIQRIRINNLNNKFHTSNNFEISDDKILIVDDDEANMEQKSNNNKQQIFQKQRNLEYLNQKLQRIQQQKQLQQQQFYRSDIQESLKRYDFPQNDDNEIDMIQQLNKKAKILQFSEQYNFLLNNQSSVIVPEIKGQEKSNNQAFLRKRVHQLFYKSASVQQQNKQI